MFDLVQATQGMVNFKGRSSLKQFMRGNPLSAVSKYGVDSARTMGLHAVSRFTWEQLVQWRKALGLEPPWI